MLVHKIKSKIKENKWIFNLYFYCNFLTHINCPLNIRNIDAKEIIIKRKVRLNAHYDNSLS